MVIKLGNNASGNRGCYEYGELGHFQRECITLRDHGGDGKGWAFVICARYVINDPNVIGMFPVNKIYASVLFD